MHNQTIESIISTIYSEEGQEKMLRNQGSETVVCGWTAEVFLVVHWKKKILEL